MPEITSATTFGWRILWNRMLRRAQSERMITVY
jgi:hypothetical protein